MLIKLFSVHAKIMKKITSFGASLLIVQLLHKKKKQKKKLLN